MMLGLVGAVLAGILVWKFITMEDDIKELRSRIEELEDERIIKVVDDGIIEDDIPF